ncbi:MAG: polysaccharide deacetylase family protein [Candidatus Omnitrophota bacterium]
MIIKKRHVIVLFIAACASALVFYAKSQYVVPIIMYHKIDYDSGSSRLVVSPESFSAQMNFLKRHKYNVVGLEELAEMVKKDKIPPKTIAITFDDGYEDNYIHAFPVLSGLGLKATIFVIPAMIGTPGYLNWDQVMEISESGVVSIGSHTMTHAWLPGQPEQVLEREISGSRRSLEGHLGRPVSAFSYPVGGFDDNARNKVMESGYKIAVTTNPGRKYPKHDIFAMKRLRVSKTSDNLTVFWFETTGFYTWVKEHRDKD